jgi:signal transduction histidine kinase
MNTKIFSLSIKFEQDVVQARKRCRDISELLGFDQQDQTRITTAISEIARNTFQYAGAGTVRFNFVEEKPGISRARFDIEVEDQGPGIENLERILSGKYVSRTGMGVGLTGARRLMDGFQIETGSTGTKVLISKDLPLSSSVRKAADLLPLVAKLVALPPANAFDELRQQNQSLIDLMEKLRQQENELKAMNSALASTNLELEQKKAFQELFVSTLSHDLRSPLTSARLMSEMIRKKIPVDDPQNEKLQRVIKNIDRSNEMISDLLDYSQVQAGGQLPLELADCDLRTLAQDAIEELETLKGKRFSLDAPSVCIGHWSGRALRRVLDNLLTNALKYGSADGMIRVQATMENTEAKLIVANEGNVIPPKELTTLFEPYRRAASAKQSTTPGWGLGLALVQGIANAHGGSVEAESTPEKGTLFTVTLPLDSRAYQSRAHAAV